MNSPNTIAHYWGTFEAALMKREMPEDQRVSMKLAFYGGASSMLDLTRSVGEDAISEAAGVALLQTWIEETRAFALEMGALAMARAGQGASK